MGSPGMRGTQICVPPNKGRPSGAEVGPAAQGPSSCPSKNFESLLLLPRLLAPVENTHECLLCPPRGRRAAIFSRLPYLALEMVLNRQVVVAMVTPLHQRLNLGRATGIGRKLDTGDLEM